MIGAIIFFLLGVLLFYLRIKNKFPYNLIYDKNDENDIYDLVTYKIRMDIDNNNDLRGTLWNYCQSFKDYIIISLNIFYFPIQNIKGATLLPFIISRSKF